MDEDQTVNEGLSHNGQYSTATTAEDFRINLAEVNRRIESAAARAGRDSSEIELLPVSKTVPQERIREAVAAGCHKLGENKVQEAFRKSAEMSDLDIDWAVIGHLQSNKARDVAKFASEFQALDRLKVAAALDRRLEAAGRSLDVYVQVNTSAEESKFGMPRDELLNFLRELPQFPNLNVQGLMTLAVFSSDLDRVRTCFQGLRTLRDQAQETDPELIGAGKLSMGMSGDYEVAIEEGANCVRVGQAIFGRRALPDSYYWPENG
ncbi:YggS family pyridoxal phosphate-dependent enzyme [Brevibacterium sp. UCMA 11752]|uniref:YggS family pyridoxal phosphate-dependent enzyme n=1 Tax=Brevibacterium sp. UCMA 11752 TaxID=2745946 RepID=UPI001F46B039|nr:YggS family pyridoxal phosphate-dependent enzyme [Brevibacterium sp. UCMA 11752]MCF2588265.1 YggS family pyridoxal phosphate-dependent enzyme [Brevibacterium sp. UCMA 11752]